MKHATPEYVSAFMTIFDCIHYIRGETNSPFLKVKKVHGNERVASIESLKKTGAAALDEFNQKNRTYVGLSANYVGGSDSDVHYFCNVFTKKPVVKGRVNIPCIEVSLKEEIQKTPSQMLSSLGELKKMCLTRFRMEQEGENLLPVKSFSKGRIARMIDNSSGSIDLVGGSSKPRLFSTVEYYPQRQDVKINYDDDGKLLGAKPRVVSKEREWIEETVRILTSS